jgi:transglutaminase superfamily protein
MRTLSIRKVESLIPGLAGYTLRDVRFKNMGEEAAYLRRLVDQFSSDLALKEFALKIVRDAGAAARAEVDQALAIGSWVQRNIYYVHETRETFQSPHITLRMKAGDCDKHAVLICAMLGTIGIRNKLCILKINGHWAHIFAVAICAQDGEAHRLTLDSTLDQDRYPIDSFTNPIALAKSRGDRVEPLIV